nr:elongation factor P maturation arginine rhamnosyltransferase EarP [Hydrogenophilus thiooxidans]
MISGTKIAIFCARIDNWGDIGVTWRLARVLAQAEHAVVWWVDDWHAAQSFVARTSSLPTLTVRRWHRSAPTAEDRDQVSQVDAVIEAFACGFSDPWLAAFAARRPHPPRWIVLDHLVTEPWAGSVHGLSSPHPRLPLDAQWCIPGFEPRCGGLLREPDLLTRFAESPDAEARAFFTRLTPLPATRYRRISLFCYADAPLSGLLAALAEDPTPTLLFVPPGAPRQALAAAGIELDESPQAWLGTPHVWQPIPFLPPDDYDRLLALSHLNWVRGEDSFVRAQWAARPFVWSPYRRADGAHVHFAEAFRTRFGGHWPLADTETRITDAPYWRQAFVEWEAWAHHAAAWRETLLLLPELGQTVLGMSLPIVR